MPERPRRADDRRFALALSLVLLCGSLVRVAYTATQTSTDPWFAFPMIDGRYYVDWASDLAAGGTGPAGAFYLAPLYPYLLAGVMALFGRSFLAIYALQHALIVAAAATIAVGGRRVIGARGALAAAALLLLHHPILFFAARPLGESVAIFLLVGSVVAAWREGPRAGFVAGVLGGLASLARPNLLLVPLVFALLDLRAARLTRLAALAAGVALVLSPVTLRNARASGHFVPISSNSGLTAFHGNGPGAGGIFTRPPDIPFDAADQRDAATEAARARSGRDLDAVEADAWWGRLALAERLSRPLDTAGLLAWRAALTLGDREFGLDYPPMLDPNPLRLTLRLGPGFEIALVPWALLLGLAAAGVASVGWRGTGGPVVWSALAACLATPVAFYVSSRYRLPAAALLTIPAGAGLAELVRVAGKHATGALVGAILFATSLLVPSGSLFRLQLAQGLVNRAAAYRHAGAVDRAMSDVRQALYLDPESIRARLVAGELLLDAGRFAEAEGAFREARQRESLPQATAGLAASLAAQGRVAEAESELRRELVLHPRNARCWNTLVALLYAAGDVDAARRAAEQARRSGVRLEAGILDDLGREPGGAAP